MASQQDLARKLLRRAKDDQAATVALLDVSSVSDALAGFHAQQAVEKALKAVLALNGVEFPFSHDLRLLIGLCEAADISLPSELDDVDRLSPYAARLRYGDEESGSVDRATGMRWAATAIAWARTLIEPGDT